MAFNEAKMLFETENMEYMNNYMSDDSYNDEIYDYDEEDSSFNLYDSSYYKDEFDRMKTKILFEEEEQSPQSKSMRLRCRSHVMPKVYNLPSMKSLNKELQSFDIQDDKLEETDKQTGEKVEVIESVDTTSVHSESSIKSGESGSELSYINSDLITLSKLRQNEPEYVQANSKNLPIGSVGLSYIENKNEQDEWSKVDNRRKKANNEVSASRNNKQHCIFFFKKGYCKFGNKCRFSHAH